MAVFLTDKAKTVLRDAYEHAKALGHPLWDSEHVLLALCQPRSGNISRGTEILERLGVTEQGLRELIGSHHPPPAAADDVYASRQMSRVSLHTRWLAAYLRQVRAGTEHVLLGTMWDCQPNNRVLRDLPLTFDDVYREVAGHEPPREVAPERVVYVSVDDLGVLLDGELDSLLPEGVYYTFNHDDRIAWLQSSSDVDLERYVQQALNLKTG